MIGQLRQIFLCYGMLLATSHYACSMEGPGCWLTTYAYSNDPAKTHPIATQTLQHTALFPFLERGQLTLPLQAIPEKALPDVLHAVQAHYALRQLNDKETHQSLLTQLHTRTDTAEKLHALLMAANYIGHEELLEWCQNKWAEQQHETHDDTAMPMEIETPIATQILASSGFTNTLSERIARSMWINHDITYRDPHNNSLWSTAVSPNGSRIATGDHRGHVTVYNPTLDQPLFTFRAHHNAIMTIAFSHDGAHIITCARDGAIKFWDSTTGQHAYNIETQAQNPFVFRFSSDQQYLAYNQGALIVLFDTKCTTEKLLPGHQTTISDIVFNHDSSLLASSSWDKKIKIWDTATGDCIKTFGRHRKGVLCLQFSADGTQLAAGSEDRTITVYDITHQKLIATLRGHRRGIWCINFALDNQLLVSGGMDGTIKIWDLTTKRFIKNLRRHRSEIQSMGMHDNGMLVSVSRHGYVNVWQLSTLIKAITCHKTFVTQEANVNQACLIAQAVQAPPHEPLDCCTHKRAATFETLPTLIQKILQDQCHVQPPTKKQKQSTGQDD